MFKRFVSIILVMAILSTMWIAPTAVGATSVPDLPTGDLFSLSTEDVDSFKAGDTVKIKFEVTDIPEENYLLAIDLKFKYNSDLLTPAVAVEDFPNSFDELNQTEGVAWEVLGRVEDDILHVSIMDDGDSFLGTNVSGALWVEMVFTAVADGSVGDWLVYSTYATAMDTDFYESTGNGMAVYVKESDIPTVTPTIHPDFDLPTGDLFTLSTEDIDSFKAGDTVKIKFEVTDIPEENNLLAIDLDFKYNSDILTPVTPVSDFPNSFEELNQTDGVAWEVLGNVEDDVIKLSLLDDGSAFLGTNVSGALWVEMVFTAVADGNSGDWLVYSTKTVAMDTNCNESTGNGMAAYVKVADVPTVTPGATLDPDIVIPTGDMFSLYADNVASFKAGDTVKVKFEITEIIDGVSLICFDLYFYYNDAILAPLEDLFTSSCEELNVSTPEEDAWEMGSRIDANGGLYVGLWDEGDDWLGTDVDGALWVELVFTALEDGSAGDWLIYSSAVEAMDSNFEYGGYGNGIAVCVEETTCSHIFGEWVVDYESTCTQEGRKHRVCSECGSVFYENIETIAHDYEIEVVPPTYLEQGYTKYTCSVCGDTYNGTYVDPLERVDLSNAALELEYTSVYYEGMALTPDVTLTYEGETYDVSKELKITYTNNNQVGTATVTVEGINKFKGTVELTFDISYEVIPEQIINVIAIGEIGKISLSWGKSSEVNTDTYLIYRKAATESEYQLIKTVTGRETVTYEDTAVEKGQTYSYYVVGVGLYGAESEASLTVSATVLVDVQAPTILKITPVAASMISGKVTLSATVTDNVGVTKVSYFYSLDNEESWIAIGESTNSSFSTTFDTSLLTDKAVKVKAIAYDAENNESNPMIVAYSLDNIGPDKVTGLSAVTLSSKITLSWNDVSADDAAYFILQVKNGDVWSTVARNIKTLGYTITGLQPDTEYTYRVACVDTHGNIGEYSDEFTARTAIDETAPVITSQSPNSARYNSTIKFSATAKDDCDIETIEIQVSTDLSSWTTISTNTYTSRNYTRTYSYTIDLSEYEEGSIFVRAIAADFSGNISDTGESAPYTEYVVDRTAPSAPLNVIANGNDGYITVSWDMGSEADLGKYSVYKATSSDGEYKLIASNLSTLNYHDRSVEAGVEYYYKVKVSDICGNVSEYSDFVSATMSPDTQKPEITSISSTYNQVISNSIHTINVTANDNNKLSYIVVEYYSSKNTEYVQLAKVENIDNYYKSISVTLPVDGLEYGDNVFVRAYAVDMAGLKSDYATSKYTFDDIPPIVENFNADLYDSAVYLTWTDCGESDLSGFKVYRSVDGVNFTLLGSRGASSTGAYTFVDTLTAKESNTYIYKLEAVDRSGNTASWMKTIEYTYVYINKAPVAKMNIPGYMTMGVEETFDASGSTDDIVIISYLWDFGDGTTSTETKPVKRYDAIGTYTVTLSVTDNEGVTSTITKDVEVKEREVLGTLNVKVIDDSGKSLSYVPVYFDLGSDNQKIVYTDTSGVATLQMVSGSHTIGMYASGYLPVKKDVVVLANATRTVTLTTVEEELVTGNFEITRMTFDEIVAAGIDVYDPANQNVYSATVRVTYGTSKPLNISYVRNDNKIISYTITDSNGKPVKSYENNNGETRKITGITYIPSSSGNSDVVAIMDIPAGASYLKEFFDVRLHIINNASSEFVIENSEVVLNVPDGMTLMTSVSGDYLTSNVANIDSIKGQENVTLAWVLRGDKAGEYDLSADFTGTLAEFNELVTARFETEEPIKVYGLEGVKFRILAADEIHNDTLYFNIELENERDIDIYMPSIGLTDKIANVTESVLNENSEGDFFCEAYILNAYIQTDNGEKLYIPVTYDANGKATTAIETLAPGQKIVYEYVAYNAINYDGVASFKDAAITEFEGVIDNIEVGSFHKELYSFTDYSEKLDEILSGSDATVAEAYNYIMSDWNYYYHEEAADKENGILKTLYTLCDVVLNADLSHFTEEEKRDLIKTTILSILSDSSVVEQADALVMMQYNKAVKEMIELVKMGTLEKFMDGDVSASDISGVFADIIKESKSLAVTYRKEGSDAFKAELSKKIAGSSLGLVIDASAMLEFGDEVEIFSKGFGTAKSTISAFLNAADETERDMYYYSVLKFQCNAEISSAILDAIINATDSSMQSEYADADLINGIACDLKEELNTNMEEYYENMDYAVNLMKEAGEAVAKAAIKAVAKKIIGSTPLAIVSAGFNILNAIFGFDNFYKQQDVMCVYDALTATFIDAFDTSKATRNEDSDYYSMLYLRAICELRLEGESKFKTFMQEYIDGVYGKPLSEAEVVEKINGIISSGKTSFDEWYDDVQYNIVHARDILFNVESTSSIDIPRAPVVTLDYDLLQTVQSFSSEYEYCFADGVWKDCANGPITFEVGVTPPVLRVRRTAGDENLAGEITTVKIFARKDLSKLITVKFDGISYLLDNLSSNYNYQIVFLNLLEDTVDWSLAETVTGSDSTVTVNGIGKYSYVAIRSCQNSALYETTSNPLYLTVSEKQPLNLIIDGSGTVTQTATSGCYFTGESVDLLAKANDGCEFEGWYIDDVCVSTDAHYIVEMSDNLEITAKFTGVKIKGVSIEELPSKLEYYEGEALDLTGIKVLVTYTDDTTAYVEQYAAYMTSNIVGKSNVIVTYGGYSTSYDINIVHDVEEWVTVTSPTLFNEGLNVKKCSACHKVIESEVLPMLVDESGTIIDSDKYLIYNIPEELLTSEAFTEHYNSLGCRVSVLSAASNASSGIVTGGYVMLAGKKYETVMSGDITGDGVVDVSDVNAMLDHIKGKTILEGAYKQAGLLVSEDEIGIEDVLTVLESINGEGSSIKYFSKGKVDVSKYVEDLGTGYECSVYSDNGFISSDEYISTGMKFIITNTETGEAYAKDVVLYGDVNGDGKVTTKDYIFIKQGILKTDYLTGLYFTAGDVNRDGKLSTADYIKIKSNILGLCELPE